MTGAEQAAFADGEMQRIARGTADADPSASVFAPDCTNEGSFISCTVAYGPTSSGGTGYVFFKVSYTADGPPRVIQTSRPATEIDPNPNTVTSPSAAGSTGTSAQSAATTNQSATTPAAPATTTLPTVKSGPFSGLRQCGAVDYAAPQVSCAVSEAIFEAALNAMRGGQNPPAQVSATLPDGSRATVPCRQQHSLVVCGDSEAVFSAAAAASGP